MNLNFIGSVVREPEIKLTKKNTEYAVFNLAENRLNETIYVNCVCFDQTKAQLAKKYFRLGTRLSVNAQLSNLGIYTNKKNETKASLSAIVLSFDFLTDNSYRKKQEEDLTPIEDIPF